MSPAGSDGDRIELRGLRVLGTHGVLPEERDRAQPFEIDLDVSLDLAGPAASDDLADTVDYAELAELAAMVASTRSFALLEALAGAAAEEVLAADPRIVTVSVTVRKLRPPVPLDLVSVGVRVVRHRA